MSTLHNAFEQFQYLSGLNILTLRQKLELLVKVYYHQLTEGCYLGDQCQNETCFHNFKSIMETSLSPEECARKALELAKQAFIPESQFHFCMSPSPVMPLLTSYGSLGLQLQAISRFAIDHLDILKKYLELIFPHADSLTHSFITDTSIRKLCSAIINEKKNNHTKDTTPSTSDEMEDVNGASISNNEESNDATVKDTETFSEIASEPKHNIELKKDPSQEMIHFLEPDINTDDVVAFYKLIQEQDRKGHPELPASILKGLTKVTTTLKKSANRITVPSKLRQIIIMLLNPYMMENEYFEILLEIFIAVSSLSNSMREALLQWLKNLPKVHFYSIVRTVQQFITLQIYARYIVDPQIMYATMFLSVLNDANELHENDSEKIDYKEFYNDAVNNIVDLKSDVIRWRDLKRGIHPQNATEFSNFTFIKYPFILDPNSKSEILAFISKYEQQQEATGAIVSNFLSGRLQNPHLVLHVDRKDLIHTALHQIDMNRANLKKPLKVKFIGEEGMDEGGVRKEMFLLIVREMFNENYGMFTYNKESGSYWFSENSIANPSEYNLIGTVIGLALYNAVILDVHFPMLLYKKLCGMEPTLEDVMGADPELGRGLKQLLEFEGDVESVYCRNFVVDTESFGLIQSHPLKPNGENIPVTNENRAEYVDLFIKWKYTISVQDRFDAFSKGFRSVLGETIEIFKPQELELLVCGSPKLDFDELRKGTRYGDGYTSDSQVIHWLWEVIEEFTDDEKRRFLHFCTGSDRAPISGLRSTQLVVIRNGDSNDRLPTAHTCFNLFLLPEYSSKEILKDRLYKAIEFYKGFGLQ